MGIRKEHLDFLIKNTSLFKAKMLELGNQQMRDFPKSAKEYFGSIGCYHLSIDRNGLDGSMVYDLGKEINIFDNEFDIITNFGTSCYVDDYNICYSNIHRMCKNDGIMIHILPFKGSKWVANHFVDEEFFLKLAKKFNYKIKDIKEMQGIHGKLLMVALIK